MTTKLYRLFLGFLLGGCTFWIAEGLFSLLWPVTLWRSGTLLNITETICLPVILIAVVRIVPKRWVQQDLVAIAYSMVIGIWVFSPFYTFVTRIISGKGIIELKDFAWLLIVFPETALVEATFSGGLFALIAASIVLPTAAIIMTKNEESSNT